MIADQQLRIITNAEIGHRFTLQTSDDLQNWIDLETIRAEEDSITFIDGFAPPFPSAITVQWQLLNRSPVCAISSPVQIVSSTRVYCPR